MRKNNCEDIIQIGEQGSRKVSIWFSRAKKKSSRCEVCSSEDFTKVKPVVSVRTRFWGEQWSEETGPGPRGPDHQAGGETASVGSE